MNVGRNYIVNMDCLLGMTDIEAGSVDMVLCDLPYGVTDNSWDTIIPLDKLWEQYKRICKPNAAIVLTACQPFTSTLVVSNPKWFRYEWIWKKHPVGFLNAKKQPLRNHESILVFSQNAAVYNPQGLRPCKPRLHGPSKSTNYGTHDTPSIQVVTGYPTTILEFGKDHSKIHPTQKPVALFEYLIRTYTNPGELVLDNCMGSGTTAIAAINTGRNYIGFERDEGYYTAALKRIQEHTSKANLDGLFEDDAA